MSLTGIICTRLWIALMSLKFISIKQERIYMSEICRIACLGCWRYLIWVMLWSHMSISCLRVKILSRNGILLLNLVHRMRKQLAHSIKTLLCTWDCLTSLRLSLICFTEICHWLNLLELIWTKMVRLLLHLLVVAKLILIGSHWMNLIDFFRRHA